ncbi:MAG: hypothetical protein V4592_21070 [Bacteroidota bacterium]
MKVYLISAVVLIVLLICWYTNHTQYKMYYHAKINGILDSTYTYKASVTIIVNGESFNIEPLRSSINQNKDINTVLSIGDRVSKYANNDTLKITHAGIVYKYTVRKW